MFVAYKIDKENAGFTDATSSRQLSEILNFISHGRPRTPLFHEGNAVLADNLREHLKKTLDSVYLTHGDSPGDIDEWIITRI